VVAQRGQRMCDDLVVRPLAVHADSLAGVDQMGRRVEPRAASGHTQDRVEHRGRAALALASDDLHGVELEVWPTGPVEQLPHAIEAVRAGVVALRRHRLVVRP